MSEFYCQNCGYVELDVHGRCSKCGSENISVSNKVEDPMRVFGNEFYRAICHIEFPEKTVTACGARMSRYAHIKTAIITVGKGSSRINIDFRSQSSNSTITTETYGRDELTMLRDAITAILESTK